eukprot:TRINITY_DN3629_c0_g1_i1.p1 TRINITY_DN3629_c0_g1~~TRINITY_DN3629_c0_g1_i1.p1  ORF type:complete len:285 (-),score=42.10 TRINITY_DN3629_c0_g1_i1:42-836(-)
MYNNNYDQPMGGGFIASSPGDGNPSSPGKSPAKGGRSGNFYQSIRPVTIKYLQNKAMQAEQESFTLDGADLHQVTIVGLVLQVSHNSINTSVQMSDGTGTIDVRSWSDSEQAEGDQKNAWLREGVYVRAIGQFRSFNQKKSIVGRFVPITDHNEVTFHFLEAIQTHLFFTRGAPQQNVGVQQNAGGFSNYNAPVTGPNTAFLGELENMVLQVLRNSVNQTEGSSVTYIAQQLSRPVNDVRRAIDFLSNEGHVYSTINEDYYQCV